MCWNAEISLNTFLFGAGSLALIIYNNTYTKYKIEWFNNVGLYVFMALVVSMQLVEFFLWRNLANPFYNKLFSLITQTIIWLQPLALAMSISYENVRKWLTAIYLLISIPLLVHNFQTHELITQIGKNGNLLWKFSSNSQFICILWALFLFACLAIERRWILLAFGVVTIFIAYYNYSKFHTVGSVWCWTANSGFLVGLAYMLIYLPLKEHCKIC